MPKNTPRMEVIIQEWEESESGWGVRPDGASIHRTMADHAAFIEKEWGSRDTRGPVPEEYSRPCGEPYSMAVPKALYDRIGDSMGAWICQTSLYELKHNPAA
jgi:hypothetical protein